MTGNAGSFCASTIFTSASWGAVASGAYFVAFGGNVLPVNHILGQNTATTSGTCTTCPSTTTTTTTTSTTTTTTTIAFSGSVAYSGNDATVCYTPVATFTMTGNAGSFCASTIFTSASWGAVASGAYFVAFGGNVLPVNHILGQNTATTSGTCTACPITTTTTSTTSTTTTAAPVAYTIDNGANGNPYGACVGSVPTSVVYAEPGNTVPIVGLILYTNQNLTTPFVGSTGWRKLVNPSSVAYAAEVDASGEITNYVTCTSQTTTTTSTTTSTTTLPGIAFGVSITTKYGTEFLACGGTVTGTRYQPPAFGNVPTDGAQLYTDSTLQTTWTPAEGSGLYLFQFGGSTKWAVFVGVTGIVGAVSACSGVTTTTTSTTSTTTTIPIYTYLGNTNPTFSTLLAACQNYATIRPYYSTKSNLNQIGPTDIIYDSYPGTPTNGGNLWVALTSGGVDPKLGFQIGTNGAVLTSGGDCANVLTTSTTTTTTTAPITTSTTTTTTTLAPGDALISIATNNSLDLSIYISQIEVNGVAVTDVIGVDPNTPGNGGSCRTTEIGTFNITIPYSAGIPGQSISLVDSDLVPQCQGAASGSGFVTFTGVVVNAEQPVTIEANEGSCA
jgi:hypothetical protein